MITKVQSMKIKEATLLAKLCKVCSSVRISGITQRYDHLVLTMYFENGELSGGGKVEKIDLLGDGVAIVTFKDPKGMLLLYLALLHTFCIQVCSCVPSCCSKHYWIDAFHV